MNGSGQERMTQAAVVPVLGPSAGPSLKPFSVWDGRIWLLALPLALIVIYAFFPILDNDFIFADDGDVFLDNPYFRGLGVAQVKWAWSTFWYGVYQPLGWMLYEVQYVFCQLDPHGYHFTSLLLHTVNTVVLSVLTAALLLRSRTDSGCESPWTCSLIAGLATALFAVHPLRVEPVAWASCQPYLPCALFSMLSVLAYLRAFWTSSCPQRRWLAGSFFLFVVALLFKAPAVTLPAVLLVLDVYPLRRFPDEAGRWFGASARRALLEKVPFVMVSLLFMGLAIAAKARPTFPTDRNRALAGIACACYAAFSYPVRTAIPLDIITLSPPPEEPNWLAFPYNVSILVTLATSAALFLLRHRMPALLAAWLTYLVILAPNSGLVRYNEVFMPSPLYSYMATLGWVAPAAAGFCRLWRTSSRWRPVAIGVIVTGLAALAGLTALTRNHARLWRDTDTLASHLLAHGGSSYFSLIRDIAIDLDKRGRREQADALFTEALRLNPGDISSHIHLGQILSRRGKYAEAEAHFAEVARLHPEEGRAQSNWGKILYNQRNYEGSAAHFAEALRLNPRDADVHNSLGVVLDKQGKYDEALARFTEALRLNPGSADAHNNVATILVSRGKYAEAEAQYAAVARLNAQDDMAHNNLGKVLSQQGKNDEAVAHFKEALRLNPGSVDAHYNLGLVFSHVGNHEGAMAQFGEAMRLQPADPRSYNASALLMAACPDAKFRDGKKAVEWATHACELTQWKNPVTLDTLAAAQAEAGDFDAAVKSQKRAIDLLTNEPQKADYRSRLVLYQAKRPYRQVAPRQGPSAMGS